MTTETSDNCLYFGDNLGILREQIRDESVDLIYLDPPFNSARDYNILFASPKGRRSEAQIVAFKDSWQWGMQAEQEFNEIVRGGNTDAAEMIQAMRRFLGENDMMAYLVMMANRLLELHRVLKPGGSLYLHCDPTASHYLKIVLDSVFGKTRYGSEISWKRSSAHNDASQGRKLPGNIRDIIFLYTKSDPWTWNWLYTPYDEDYVRRFYTHVDEKSGRRYRLGDLTAARPGGDVSYDFHGARPYKGRYWAYSRENMEKFHAEGRLYFPKNGGTPSYKRYLDEMPGVALQNDWDDIRPVPPGEYLGYPTQKPLALLERIVQASSNEGDVLLDPFCGCGTAVHAAHKLKRQWIGIDITHLAICLIEKRLKDAFPGVGFAVHGTPKDLEGARDLAARDKYQFQWWGCSLVNAQPFQGRKKGANGGVDGLIYFQDEPKAHKKIVLSVKGGSNVNVAMVRDLVGVLEREKAEIGLFVTLAPPTAPMRAEAAKAGFYESPTLGKAFPRLQILTIEGLLEGRERPDYPDLAQGGLTFKKAKREERAADQKPLF
ncbi:MAG: restriction endonuclease [Candidatus Accumulibacter sp.]|jgi:DNA modification methylase|nr:restriction endonuclease [Accumulibacter sp.]